MGPYPNRGTKSLRCQKTKVKKWMWNKNGETVGRMKVVDVMSRRGNQYPESHTEMGCLAVASPLKCIGQHAAEDFGLEPQGQYIWKTAFFIFFDDRRFVPGVCLFFCSPFSSDTCVVRLEIHSSRKPSLIPAQFPLLCILAEACATLYPSILQLLACLSLLIDGIPGGKDRIFLVHDLVHSRCTKNNLLNAWQVVLELILEH